MILLRSPILSALLIVPMLFTYSHLAHGQQTANMTVEDPRPVAKAIEELEILYGTPITYEDTIYANSNEMLDVTSSVRRDHNTAARVMIPRGGAISFLYTLPSPDNVGSSKMRSPAVLAAVVNVLNADARARGAEMFSVDEEQRALHVVPAQFKNASGRFVHLKPLLDYTISIQGKQRTANELIEEICQLISVASGMTVFPGAIPINYLNHVTTLGATNETAQSVLGRLANDIGLPLMSWQLFCDPIFPVQGNLQGTCALNIHIVKSSIPG